MAPKIFLDANVLLDFLLKRKNYSASRQLIALAQSGDIRAITSPAILHIIAYWLSKEHGARQAKKIIAALLNEVTIVDATHETAISAVQSASNDLEDALQYFTALLHKADFLLSWDKQFARQSLAMLPVMSPDVFLRSHFPDHR